ncbi:BatD family protein [Ferruginibacter albus]|uniref:BatD family protein n=1 Tax=Ferruginibacter albus TaxID=2875540 RepID=UPI001CC7FC72|nr:BatD family protein [Ferruginibacter albus]UAY52992.1 BatD family protein [Ferruginibacter albus]
MNKIFFIALLLLAYSSINAQAKFTATIKPATISTDQTAELTFTVENVQQVAELQTPELKDFIVVSGPNQQSSMQMINGDIKQSLTLSYIIQPKSTGTFEIGQASAKLNDKVVKSNKLILKVTKGSAPDNKKEEKKNNKAPEKKNEINTEENYTFVIHSFSSFI